MPYYKTKYRVSQYYFSVWSRFGLENWSKEEWEYIQCGRQCSNRPWKENLFLCRKRFQSLASFFPGHTSLGTKNSKQTNNNINRQKTPTQTSKQTTHPKTLHSSLQHVYKPTQIKLKLIMHRNEKAATLWIVWGQILLPLNRILEIKIIAFTKCQTIPIAYRVEIEDS